jgi:ATP-dependent DNA helicase 2 subunit 1
MLKEPEHSYDKKSSKDSAVVAALKSAHKVMQQRIISNPKDQMGIILFGTEKTKYLDLDGKTSVLSYPHCYVYTPLDVPSAEEVKQLRGLVDDREDEDGVLFPSSDGARITDLLFCANQIFTLKAPNFGSRRLFIITDNDDPHPGDKEASEASFNRAKDLYDLGVTIEVFPITHADAKFDLTKFYDVSSGRECFLTILLIIFRILSMLIQLQKL